MTAEECYRQNRDVMKVTVELWLEIADNIEDFASQAVEYYKNKVIKQIEEKRDFCYTEMEKERNETDYFSEYVFEEHHNKGKAFNECLEILKSATNGKNVFEKIKNKILDLVNYCECPFDPDDNPFPQYCDKRTIFSSYCLNECPWRKPCEIIKQLKE